MGDNIAAANPEKDMLRLCSVRCPHMNLITLENTLDALQVQPLRDRSARRDPGAAPCVPFERMIAIG